MAVSGYKGQEVTPVTSAGHDASDLANDAIRVNVVAGGAGGGAVTIADGADVAEGSKADVAWVSGDGTVISLLKKIASAGGGSAVSIADGADVAEGTTTDAAVITDTAGTLSGKLRGLVKWAFERMPTSLGQKVKTASLPVVLASDQDALTITNTGFIANAGTNLNTSLLALEAGGNLALIKADVDKLPSQGTAIVAASMPVNIASDQVVPVSVSSLPLSSNAAIEAGGNLDKMYNNEVTSIKPLLQQILVEMRVIAQLLDIGLNGKNDLDVLRNEENRNI